MKTILKKMMADNKTTQTKLSEETKITRPTISKILNEEGGNIGIQKYITIANYFNISLNELIIGDEEEGTNYQRGYNQAVLDMMNELKTLKNAHTENDMHV